MSKSRRFTLSSETGSLVRDPAGAWVPAGDYDKLLAERNEFARQLRIATAEATAEAEAEAAYPPVVQALLDACEDLVLVDEGNGVPMPARDSDDALRVLARAIDHYRAAKAEGFVPAPADAAEARIAAALAVVELARVQAADPFSGEERVYAWGRESAESVTRLADAIEEALRG